MPGKQLNFRWNESSVKWAEQIEEYVDGVHLFLVFLTKLIHNLLLLLASTSSLFINGILNNVIPFSIDPTLLQPNITQRLSIFAGKQVKKETCKSDSNHKQSFRPSHASKNQSTSQCLVVKPILISLYSPDKTRPQKFRSRFIGVKYTRGNQLDFRILQLEVDEFFTICTSKTVKQIGVIFILIQTFEQAAVSLQKRLIYSVSTQS